MADVESRVCQLIINELGVDPEKVTPDARLVDDLGADSLDLVELVMGCEEEFGVTIPDEEAQTLRTVGDVINYIKAHQNDWPF